MPVVKKIFNDKILNGKKTQIRRIIKNPLKPYRLMTVGNPYKIRNDMYEKDYVCKILCTRRLEQRLHEIPDTDVFKEGFTKREDVINFYLESDTYKKLGDLYAKECNNDPEVYVYEFKVIQDENDLRKYGLKG